MPHAMWRAFRTDGRNALTLSMCTFRFRNRNAHDTRMDVTFKLTSASR